MLAHERLQLADELAGESARELSLVPLLERAHPQLLQPRDACAHGRLVDEVRQRWTSPESKGCPETIGRLPRLARVAEFSRGGDQGLERVEIDASPRQLEEVAAPACDQAAVAEHLPQS